ncbi:23108_t:CDS:2, partial [Gigaspora margarita]
KQVIVNATHVSNKSLPQELEEFTNEEDEIDELEIMLKYRKSSSLIIHPLKKITCFIIHVGKEQFGQAESLLNENTHLQPLETPTKEYYQEFNNFMDTYLCNSMW